MPGAYVVYAFRTSEASGGKFRQSIDLMVWNDRREYRIACESDLRSFPDLRPLFTGIMNSFRLAGG
ncbi:MAG: hypothetical protein AB7P12_07985 [Alphaproteobacteria bacterium]